MKLICCIFDAALKFMKTFGHVILICFTFILYSAEIKGQHPVYRHFSVDDGLPSTEIYHVFQDSKGYIWLATNIGVSRYDGQKFVNFDKQDGLPENTVFEIYEDAIGRVWFVSFPCQLSFYYNDSIHSYKFNGILKKCVGNYAIPVKCSFVVSEKDEIKLGLIYEGLISISKDGKLTKLHPKKSNLRSAHLFVSSDRVLISQGKIMDMYSLILNWDGQIKQYDFKNESNNYTHSQLMAIRNGEDKILFVQNDFMVSIEKNNKPDIRYMDFRIFGLYRDKSGNIWVATDKHGAICFKKGDIKSEPISHVLNGISVSSIFQDSEGGMWFSTLTEGIYYLPTGSFLTYTTEEGLSSNNVNTLALTERGIVIGTNDEYINYPLNGKIVNTRVSKTKNDRIQVLFKDHAEQLWVGTNEYLYNVKRNGSIQKYFNSKYNLLMDGGGNDKSRNIFSIKTIANSIDGGIWIGESNCFSNFANEKVVYNSHLIDKAELRSEALLQLNDGTLFIGTPNGLWKFSNHHLVSLVSKNLLLGCRITDIGYFEANNGYC